MGQTLPVKSVIGSGYARYSDPSGLSDNSGKQGGTAENPFVPEMEGNFV
jgi:hypothetical protein